MHKQIVKRKSRNMDDLKKAQNQMKINCLFINTAEEKVMSQKDDGSFSSSKKKIDNGGSKKKRYALKSFDELPEYMKDNEYILNYYRADWPLKEAFFSLFRWHNETLNVWT